MQVGVVQGLENRETKREWWQGVRPRQEAAFKEGWHPATGARLAANGETCGSCAHLVENRRAKTYFKCGLVMMTFGPLTDIRKKWPACVKWTEKGDPAA
jgi:hypothetical protein